MKEEEKIDVLREALRTIDEQYDVTIAFCNSQTSLLNTNAGGSMHNTTTVNDGNVDDDNNSDLDQKNHRPLHCILEEYDTCLRRVQENFSALQKIKADLRPRAVARPLDNKNNSNSNNPQQSTFRRVWVVFESHVKRTRRILMTVQRAGGGTWSSSSYGIPLSHNDIETVTVALATLRASIETVRHVLMAHLPKE